MTYLFNDAGVAQKLRDAGFSVVLTHMSGKEHYAALDDGRLEDYLRKHFASTQVIRTSTLCF